MKKIVTILILIFVVIISLKLAKNNSPIENIPEAQTEETTESSTASEIAYYTDKSKGIYIAKFSLNDFKLELFEQKDKDFLSTVENVVIDNNITLAINAGYFREDFEHAGLLVKDGKIASDPAINDKQVTHVINFSDLTNFESIKEVDIDSLELAFQTGPLMINGGKVEEDLIKNSTNGNGNFRRSVLIISNNNDVFFLATTKSYSLIDLSNEILNNSFIGTQNLNAINLDGGSSVAMYSTNKSDFKIGEGKKLPFFLILK